MSTETGDSDSQPTFLLSDDGIEVLRRRFGIQSKSEIIFMLYKQDRIVDDPFEEMKKRLNSVLEIVGQNEGRVDELFQINHFLCKRNEELRKEVEDYKNQSEAYQIAYTESDEEKKMLEEYLKEVEESRNKFQLKCHILKTKEQAALKKVREHEMRSEAYFNGLVNYLRKEEETEDSPNEPPKESEASKTDDNTELRNEVERLEKELNEIKVHNEKLQGYNDTLYDEVQRLDFECDYWKTKKTGVFHRIANYFRRKWITRRRRRR